MKTRWAYDPGDREGIRICHPSVPAPWSSWNNTHNGDSVQTSVRSEDSSPKQLRSRTPGSTGMPRDLDAAPRSAVITAPRGGWPLCHGHPGAGHHQPQASHASATARGTGPRGGVARPLVPSGNGSQSSKKPLTPASHAKRHITGLGAPSTHPAFRDQAQSPPARPSHPAQPLGMGQCAEKSVLFSPRAASPLLGIGTVHGQGLPLSIPERAAEADAYTGQNLFPNTSFISFSQEIFFGI